MQQSLFDVLDVPAEKLKYEAFKEANPWVIERLTKMCYALYNNGHNHYGIGALVEVLRFQHSTTFPSRRQPPTKKSSPVRQFSVVEISR